MKARRYFAMAGVVGFGFYVLGILIATLLYPGYSHATQFISELGSLNSPSRTLMNFIGFIPAGILLVVFALTLASEFKRNWLTILATILVLVFGADKLLGGLFSCETNCEAANPILSETIHNTIGISGTIAMMLAMILWALIFRKSSSFKRYWLYTLGTAITAFVIFMLWGINMGSPQMGIFQRLLSLTNWQWVIVVSLKLWRDWEQPEAHEPLATPGPIASA